MRLNADHDDHNDHDAHADNEVHVDCDSHFASTPVNPVTRVSDMSGGRVDPILKGYWSLPTVLPLCTVGRDQ